MPTSISTPLTGIAYGVAAAVIAIAAALLVRLGPDVAGTTAHRHLPLLSAAAAVRGLLFSVVFSQRPSSSKRLLLALLGITAAGSLVFGALVLGPLAPARPAFPRSVVLLEGAISLGLAGALLALPQGTLRAPSGAALAGSVGALMLFLPMTSGPRWQTFAAPWPPHAIRAEYANRVESALAEWRAAPPDYAENLHPYDPRGPYFHYADVWRSADAESRFDREPHIAARYHAVHIYLLHALYDITGEPVFEHYERLWRSYVEGPERTATSASP